MKDGFLLHHRAFEHCVDNSNIFAAFLVCLIAELMPLSQALTVTTTILLGKWRHPLFPLPPFALMERDPRQVACVNVCFDCTSPSGLEFLPSAGMLHCHRGVQNRMTTGVMVVTEIAGAHTSPALSLFFNTCGGSLIPSSFFFFLKMGSGTPFVYVLLVLRGKKKVFWHCPCVKPSVQFCF